MENVNLVKLHASACNLLVSEPAHVVGGLLNNLYFTKLFLVGKHVNSTVKNIYF